MKKAGITHNYKSPYCNSLSKKGIISIILTPNHQTPKPSECQAGRALQSIQRGIWNVTKRETPLFSFTIYNILQSMHRPMESIVFPGCIDLRGQKKNERSTRG